MMTNRSIRIIKLYESTIAKFPQDVVPYAGLAEVLRSLGDLTGACDLYESTIANFPQDDVAPNGLAEVLKSMRKFDEAIAVNNTTIDKFPYNRVAINGKATVLLLQGRFKEAASLVKNDNPKNDEEFRDHHLHDMILLQSGKIDLAVKQLQWGFENCGFTDKKYFRSALAFALMQQRKFQEADNLFKTTQENEGLAQQSSSDSILKAHIAAEMNRLMEMSELLNPIEKSGNQDTVQLCGELKERYTGNPSPDRLMKLDKSITKKEFELLVE